MKIISLLVTLLFVINSLATATMTETSLEKEDQESTADAETKESNSNLRGAAANGQHRQLGCKKLLQHCNSNSDCCSGGCYNDPILGGHTCGPW